MPKEHENFLTRVAASVERHRPILDRLAESELPDMKLVPGFWCQVSQFGWLPGSATMCTNEDHIRSGQHVASERSPRQPEHSVIADWQRRG